MDALRKELLGYLGHPRTHVPLAKAVADFPVALMNKKVKGVPYTPWGLLEHIRITQHDMVDFIKNPKYRGLDWPDDYWPDAKQKTDKKMWNASLAACAKDGRVLAAAVRDPKRKLLAAISWGEGQTPVREVLQVIDHTAYHTGEFVLLRRVMGAWKK